MSSLQPLVYSKVLEDFDLSSPDTFTLAVFYRKQETREAVVLLPWLLSTLT